MTAFKKHVGQTMQRYLTQLRVMEAQRLLLQSDLAITHMALAAGLVPWLDFLPVFAPCAVSPTELS